MKTKPNLCTRRPPTGRSSRSKHSALIPQHSVLYFALCSLLLAPCVIAEAQQAGKFYRIGYLGVRSASLPTDDTSREPFRQGLRKLGYVEGQTIAIEYRFAEGDPDRVRDLAADLVRLKVDVIVSPASIAIRAAKQANRTIPIVMAGARVDPVAAGFIASLARPGGNITGLTSIDSELQGKRLELLKEVSPRISHVALLSGRLAEQDKKKIETVGRALDIQVEFLVARSPDDLEGAFSAISRNLPNALLVGASSAILAQQARIIDFATKKRLLTMYDRSQFIEAGGLMSYGVDQGDLQHRAAIFVDKILKGRKPADLPVEQPTKFELIINLTTAKQIGLTIPPNVLARADRVIR